MKIKLKVRKCNNCGHKAVALEGPSALCTDCPSGRYVARVDSTTIEVDDTEMAEAFKEKYSSEILGN